MQTYYFVMGYPRNVSSGAMTNFGKMGTRAEADKLAEAVREEHPDYVVRIEERSA